MQDDRRSRVSESRRSARARFQVSTRSRTLRDGSSRNVSSYVDISFIRRAHRRAAKIGSGSSSTSEFKVVITQAHYPTALTDQDLVAQPFAPDSAGRYRQEMGGAFNISESFWKVSGCGSPPKRWRRWRLAVQGFAFDLRPDHRPGSTRGAWQALSSWRSGKRRTTAHGAGAGAVAPAANPHRHGLRLPDLFQVRRAVLVEAAGPGYGVVCDQHPPRHAACYLIDWLSGR